MLIAVNGNIINTENIYNITPIEGDCCWSSNMTSGLSHSNFLFAICLFNDKNILVGTDISSSEGEDWWNTGKFEDYISILNKHKKRLSKFRDSIIEAWGDNQSKIPNFDFK